MFNTMTAPDREVGARMKNYTLVNHLMASKYNVDIGH
jgi:hypothetical protein